MRKATKEDVDAIYEIIHIASGYGILLLRTKADLLECIEEFWVEEVAGKVVACCALAIYSQKLAEIRSMAVLPDWQGKGLASGLLQKCLNSAKEKGIYEVLTITNRPNIFDKKGFGTQLDGQSALIYRTGNSL